MQVILRKIEYKTDLLKLPVDKTVGALPDLLEQIKLVLDPLGKLVDVLLRDPTPEVNISQLFKTIVNRNMAVFHLFSAATKDLNRSQLYCRISPLPRPDHRLTGAAHAALAVTRSCKLAKLIKL